MAEDIEKSKLNAEGYRDALKEASVAAAESRQTFNDIASQLSNNAKTSKEFATNFKTAEKDIRNLSASAAKLAQYGNKDLSNSKTRLSLNKDLANLATKRAVAESTILANRIKIKNAVGEERDALLNTNEDLLNAVDTSNALTKSFTATAEQIKEINNSTGFVDKLAEGLKAIPGLGPLLAAPVANLGKGIAQFKVGLDPKLNNAEKFAAQIDRAKNFTDALGKGALTFVIAGLVKADQATTDFAKTLGISKSEARDLGDEMNTFAVESGKAYLTVEKMMGAQRELSNSLGASAGYTKDQLQSQVMLTKKVGLQGEEAASLLKLGIATGKSTKVVTEEILNSVAGLEQETGIRLEGQKVLKEVAAANGQLGAQYGFNNKALAQAVVTANKLGLSLKETQAIAKGLLDFESSITSELEAELITGKNLNLERARGLALQGKSAEATAEIVKQLGTSADFAKLNVIQQDSLAKAAGMTSDQLANTLRDQETLNALGATNIKQLAKAGNLDKLRGTENGKLLLQQYQQQTASDKLADVAVKIQSTMAQFADPLIGVLDLFGRVAESATAVKVIVGLITAAMVAQFALQTTSKIVQLRLNKQLLQSNIKNTAVQVAKTATIGAGSVAGIPGIGGFLALGVGAAIFTGLMGYLAGAKQANDIVMPGAMGGGGYGSRTLMGPEGAISLNNKDTVIAGTNLFPKQNTSTPQPVMQQDNSEARKTNELLRAVLSQPKPQPIITMNDVQLGTAVDMGAFSIQ